MTRACKLYGREVKYKSPEETAFQLINWQYTGTPQEMALACRAQIASIFNTLFKKYHNWHVHTFYLKKKSHVLGI